MFRGVRLKSPALTQQWISYVGVLTGILVRTESCFSLSQPAFSVGHVGRVSASSSGLPLQVGAGGGDAPGLRWGQAVSGIQLGREESASKNGPLHLWCLVSLWYNIKFLALQWYFWNKVVIKLSLARIIVSHLWGQPCPFESTSCLCEGIISSTQFEKYYRFSR